MRWTSCSGQRTIHSEDSTWETRHRLGSSGAVQGALKKLSELDLIEKDRNDGCWRVTDPIFRRWLAAMRT